MKRILFLASLLLLLAACGTELEPVVEPQPKTAGDFVFYASFGDPSVPGTKVFMNEDWQLRWNAQDQISIFNQTRDNLAFAFTGTEGAASGAFAPVDGSATLTGAAVPHIYAVYPYATGTSVAADGTISLTLPAEQAYYGGVSFGRGANTMVSVTDNVTDKLVFRNVCGYLQLKLYGDDVAISRVALKGNNGEPLAGAATVTASVGGAPSVTMGAGAATEVAVVCADPVEVGTDASHYITFLLAIPPTTFEKGFTITVTDADGYVFEKSTSNRYTVARNEIFPMAPLKCREIETFQIENEGTRRYLADQTYDSNPSNYTNSVVSNYAGNDDPNPFELTVSDASQISLHDISGRYPDGHWTASVSADKIQVYNLIPGVVYRYEVRDSQQAVLKAGFVRPEGHVRWIYGVAGNMRDLGGWPATGGKIAYGKLYRGRELNSISASGKSIFLQDLGIGVDLDLRGYNNLGNPSQPLGTDCTYENIKLMQFLGDGTGETQELYQKAIRHCILWLQEGKPVFFHCVGGADRTGTLAFLIEALVGVAEADLSRDYELTTYGGQTRLRNATTSQFVFRKLIDYLLRDEFADGNNACSLNQRVENWAKTRHAQSVDPLTDDEIATLRRLLVLAE